MVQGIPAPAVEQALMIDTIELDGGGSIQQQDPEQPQEQAHAEMQTQALVVAQVQVQQAEVVRQQGEVQAQPAHEDPMAYIDSIAKITATAITQKPHAQMEETTAGAESERSRLPTVSETVLAVSSVLGPGGSIPAAL